MAALAKLVCIAAPVVVIFADCLTDSSEVFSLVQRRAEAHGKRARAGADTELMRRLGLGLDSDLSSAPVEDAAWMEAQLARQSKENAQSKRKNEDLARQIKLLQAQTKEHQGKALALLNATSTVEDKFKQMQTKYQSVGELARDTAETVSRMLTDWTLEVLNEPEVPAERRQLSLIQTGVEFLGGGKGTEDLLNKLESTYNKESFERTFWEGQQEKHHLMAEQIEMEDNKKILTRRQDELVKVEKEIQAKYKRSSQKLEALHAFSKRMSGEEKPETNPDTAAPSLLQTSAIASAKTKTKNLPPVKTFTLKHEGVIQELQTHVSDLEESLEETQKEKNEQLRQMRVVYDAAIKKAEAEAKLELNYNARTKAEIETLRTSSTGLARTSKRIHQEAEQLRKETQALKRNLSIAEDFVNKALIADNKTLSFDVPELRVLGELKDKDLAEDEDALRQDVWNNLITFPSFLQLSGQQSLKVKQKLSVKQMTALRQLLAKGDLAKRQGKVSVAMPTRAVQTIPLNLVSSLMESLTELNNEHNASAQALKEATEKELQKLVKRKAVALKEQGPLNETLAQETEYNKELKRTVNHVKAARDDLLQRLTSLRLYSARLGGISAPYSMLQIQSSNSALPKVGKLLNQESKVFSNMNSGVNLLSTKLHELESSGTAEVAKQKKEYERKLAKQT